MTQRSINLLLATVIPVCIVTILYKVNKPNYHIDQSFKRHYAFKLVLQDTLSKQNAFFFGFFPDGDDLYLTDLTAKSVLKLKDSKLSTLLQRDSLRLIVYANYHADKLIIIDQRKSKLYQYDHVSNTLKQIDILPPFSRIAPIDSSSYLIKGLDIRTHQPMFLIYSNGVKKLIKSPLKLSNDGGIGTDGFLLSDASNTVVHAQYYSPDIDVFRNGVFQFHFKTIDSLSNTIPKVRNDFQHFTAPGNTILLNKEGSLKDSILYLVSNNQAMNDRNESLLESTPVDLYNINSGRYLGSIRIPNFKEQRLSYLTVKSSLMWCIYGRNQLVKYKIISK